MPHFVAYFMLPRVAFSNSSMTSFSFNSGAKRFSLAVIVSSGKIFELLFKFKLTRTRTCTRTRTRICRLWYISSYTIMAKPIKSVELHSAMIQFLLKLIISLRL